MAKKKNTQKKRPNGMENFISSLAAASSSETKTMSKEERIQKRAAKKVRREQQQDQQQDQQDLKRPAKKAAPQKPTKIPNSQISKIRLKRLAVQVRSIRTQCADRRPYCPEVILNKKRKAKGWNENSIQPLPSDYSGIGLARESLYIPFLDQSYFPKLEEEFKEHIPGFYGKQRSKAMKRQLDGNMLWRQLAEKKKDKKFKDMTPDQRVQAMIDSGMI